MQFSDLKTQDFCNAFWNFMSVKEAKEKGIILPDYFDLVGDNCDCGSERMINVDASSLTCCNPRCKIKLAYMLEYMIKSYGGKFIGIETCKTIINSVYSKMEVKSHLVAILHHMDDLYYSIPSSAYAHLQEILYKIKTSGTSYYQVVGNLGIPRLGEEVCAKIFSGIDGGDDLVREAEKVGGLSNLLSLRGSPDPVLLFYLNYFLYELELAEASLIEKVRPTGIMELPVVITGKLKVNGNSVTRDDFLFLCNKAGEVNDKLRLFEVKESHAVRSTNFFVFDKASSSPKCSAAIERQFYEGKKLIYSANEFLALLKEKRKMIVEHLQSNSVEGMEVF